MYWLFGGASQFGTAGQDLYDAANLAANENVIVVTVNNRTNVFGFSNSPAIPLTSRNAGFYDQRLSLDWVRRNIAAFGGDPSKVTIFGQSAGADSVHRIVLSPPEPRPFRAAILQSGTTSFDRNGDTGPAAWETLASSLNCTSPDAGQELECVRAADALTIKSIIEHAVLDFSLVKDNITKLATPVNRLLHQSVPIMGGSMGQESRLFTVGQTNLTAFIETTFNGSSQLQEFITQSYAIGTPGIATDYDAIAQFETEVNYQCPIAIVCNESTLAGFPTWRYYFNASFADTNDDAVLDAVGLAGLNLETFHTSEIAFIFGTLPPELNDSGTHVEPVHADGMGAVCEASSGWAWLAGLWVKKRGQDGRVGRAGGAGECEGGHDSGV